MEKEKSKLVSAGLVALGLVLGGFFPGYYYYQAKVNNNSVTVKGLAEMTVKADLAIWKIKFTVTGNDLTAAQQSITAQAKEISNFLLKQGFGAE